MAPAAPLRVLRTPHSALRTLTMPPIITLLTDFGTADSYVAEVKAVLISSALGAALIDVTHEIPPGNIRGAHVPRPRCVRAGGGLARQRHGARAPRSPDHGPLPLPASRSPHGWTDGG